MTAQDSKPKGEKLKVLCPSHWGARGLEQFRPFQLMYWESNHLDLVLHSHKNVHTEGETSPQEKWDTVRKWEWTSAGQKK